MCNEHFKEKEMSLKAKGLLSLMLSLPDDWNYSIAGLVSICKENETAIMSTLKELKEFGYLKVTKKMPNETETGRIQYIYDVFEMPIKKQGLEKQGVENLCLEFQGVENQGQLNTYKESIKELNINDFTTTTYSEEDLVLKNQIVKGKNEIAMLFISNAQISELNKKINKEEADYYLSKISRMLADNYEFGCSHYKFLLKMINEDKQI